ncbi:ABC transporter ATP-binding protein, partial [Pantoea agglomerans]|nr:ABC transporter ATP-binding protein [Pantoea agglomerans]
MIEFDGVSRAFNGKAAVKDLSLQVAKGEFCVLLGT